MNISKKRVVIAMSGGIDSSVAAALLKEAGFEISGIFLKILENKAQEKAEHQAKSVAKKLNIPLRIIDARKEFKKEVINYFLKEISLGRTPNPCVVCNKKIKFGLLLKIAKQTGAYFLATGHYAKTSNFKFHLKKYRIEFKNEKNVKLLRAKDKKKDQSYFLWKLNQTQLKHILFPLGDLTKEEVTKLAKKFNISKFSFRDSQEICFVGADLAGFLKKYLQPKPGKIIDNKGKIIGKHYGLIFYTIGQRKGIKLSGGPYYVLKKDIKNNLLIVTRSEADLYQKELIAKEINWITRPPLQFPLRVRAKIRYLHIPALATIFKEKPSSKLRVVFDKPQRAITPGQSVVFYKRNEILGGGIIEKSSKL